MYCMGCVNCGVTRPDSVEASLRRILSVAVIWQGRSALVERSTPRLRFAQKLSSHWCKNVMSQLLFRRLLLLGVPLILGILELGHPALLPGDPIAPNIGPIVTWWTTLHVLQVPLFALLGYAVIMLLRGIDNQAANDEPSG
jgi:hypothetical protein